MKSMNILYIQQHFATNLGQAGVRGYNLVRTLVQRGHDVTVITGHNWRDPSLASVKGKRVSESSRDGFRIVHLGIYYSNKQSFLLRVFSFLLFSLLASYQVLRRKADLVFASSTPLTVSIPALCGKWLKGVPYVLEVRDLWPDLPIEMGIIRSKAIKWLLYWWERVAYRNAWKLIGLAPGIKQGIEKKAGISPDRVLMVPNGCDTDGIQPLGRLQRKHLSVPEDKVAFGYAGTLGTANGLDAILDAAAVLKRRRQQSAIFVLIGDGREKARLQERVLSEGLDNVLFTGLYNKDVYNEVLCELDAGLQILLNVPAFYYGTSPNKFFDYLAAGKPVLVNYPGWMSDLVTEHACGLAVPPDDAEAFADAVERIVTDGKQRMDMGTAARRLAETRFSQQKILIELAAFIEEPSLAAASAVDMGAHPLLKKETH